MDIKLLDEEIDNLNSNIEEFKLKRDELINQKRKLCPHNNVEMTGGEMWHSYPEYGYDPYKVKCLDCGLSAMSDDNWKLYSELRKFVTIDKSAK